MHARILLIFCIAMLMAGCGVQLGRFVTTGGQSNTLKLPVGSIDIISGRQKLVGDDASVHNLLYIIFLTGINQTQWSGSSFDYGIYFTSLRHSWTAEHETISALLQWNRRDDIVLIGKQKFARANGNVFVVHVDMQGGISGQQCGSIEAPCNPPEVLKYIKKQLPNDADVLSMQLDK